MPKSKAKMKMNRNKKAAAKGNHPNASQERQETENPFMSLPNDLIISHIFGKIPEAKSLFICSLVSKHFSSLILKTHKLSFVFPVWMSFYTDLNQRIQTPSLTLPPRFRILVSKPRKFLKQLRRPTKQKPSVSSPAKFFSSMYFGFLQKLSSISNLNIEVPFTRNCESPYFSAKWVCEYKNSNSWSSIVLSFKCLIPASAKQIAETVESTQNNQALSGFELMKIVSSVNCEYSPDIKLRSSLLLAMIDSFPILKNVIISDSINQGKVILREEAIALMRNPDEEPKQTRLCFQCWSQPLLKLPNSRVMMVEAKLGILKWEGTGEDESIAKDAFEGEEMKVYGEAAMKLLKTDKVVDDNFSIGIVNDLRPGDFIIPY